MKTFDWSSVTYRIFATGNVLVVVVGLLFLVPTAFSVGVGAVANVPTNSHFRSWFWAMTFINLCFLTLLLLEASICSVSGHLASPYAMLCSLAKSAISL